MSGWLLFMLGILQVLPVLEERTAFITQEEKDYLGVYPQPDIVASDLVEAANQIVKIDSSAVFSPVRDRADYDIFISYCRRDKEFVRHLWEALIQANQKTWIDWNDIPPTANWREEIYLGIEAANNFVFVLTSRDRDSAASDYAPRVSQSSSAT